MIRTTTVRIGALLVAVGLGGYSLPSDARTFRWSATTDPQTMDPHAVNAAPVLGFLSNVYEGLVRRGPDMRIEGALAERWEPLGSDGWRFHLRRDVRFHDGAAFTAEDVLFSYERAASKEADTASWFAPVERVEVVDEHTIDFRTRAPNPIFPDSIANFMILDKGWAEKHGARRPAKEGGNFATLNANGTGPFRLAVREPGLRTVLEPFDVWWDKAAHGITRAEFTPIQNPATAVAALLGGSIDMTESVPIQDAARLAASPGVRIMQGLEARVIMLGFAHAAEAARAPGPDAKPAPNALRDLRVRRAIAHAIDVEAIRRTIMRGAAEPASQLVSADMRGYSKAHAARPAHDPETARRLLAEAGHAQGLSLEFKCTNDRYLNDESVCQAVVAMLARVGVTARLDSMPVRNYWPELRKGAFDLYLLGWSPGTFDAEHPVRFLAATKDDAKKLGSWNFGGYSNARVDELLPRIQSELDEPARQRMLDETAGLLQADLAYLPLYVEPLVWGTRSDVTVVPRPDAFFILRWVRFD